MMKTKLEDGELDIYKDDQDPEKDDPYLTVHFNVAGTLTLCIWSDYELAFEDDGYGEQIPHIRKKDKSRGDNDADSI